MRVLIVDEEIPLPLNTGKRLRTFNLLQPLARVHEIFFVSRFHEGIKDYDNEAFEQSGMKSLIVPHPIRRKSGLRFYLALLANLFSPYPYVATSQYSKPFIRSLRALIDKKHIDLIHCENVAYAKNIQPFLSMPALLIAHNVEAMIWKRRYEVENNILRKSYTYVQWKKMEIYERRVFRRFKHIVAVSEADKAIIAQQSPATDISVIENGVDMEYFTPAPGREKSFSLVFTGSLDWFPNEDGMVYFLNEIWPLVQKKFPGCSFSIVGRDPGQTLINQAAKYPSVTLTGTVPDVRPYIDEAAVYVVPLRVGGGSRLKILEAFAMKKPVVSTTIGAEGLDVHNRKELIIADSPQDFADAIGELFSDHKFSSTIAASGHYLVVEKYQWKFLAQKLEQVWKCVATSQDN